MEPAFGGWGRYSFDLKSALEKENIEVTVHTIKSPLSFKRHFFLGWWKAIRMFREYKDNKFDVIHCVVEPYAFLTSFLAKLKNTKYIISAHGTYSILFLADPAYHLFQKYAYSNASKIIAVSSYTSRRLAQYVNLNNVVVIPSGLKYTEKGVVKNKIKYPIILSVGGTKIRKGYHLVIKALAKIKDSLGEFEYYIVGDEHDVSYAKKLRNLVKESGLGANVIMTGFISAEEKEKLYEKADIFILTPISEGLHFEGFGLVYLEAGAYGIPVIGSLDTGAEDAIKDGETGFLVPQNDPDALAKAILEILRKRDLAEKMSAGGVKWSREHDWENVIPKYIEIYKQVAR